MSNETIFREVDEELRGDRMRNIWRRFGPFIIGAAVLVVLVVAVNEGWRWWQNSNAARSSDQFYGALEAAEKGDIPAAQAALDQVIASGSGAYPTLAKFREAALLAHQGDSTGAVAAYDALATSESNQHLRDLALVLAANLLVDNGDVAAVQQRVGGLIVEGNPMRNAAREALGLTQYKAGDLNAALKTFTEIAADPLAGQEVLQRMTIYTGQLAALGAVTPEQAAANASAIAPADTATAPAEPAPAAAAPSVEPTASAAADMDTATPPAATTPAQPATLAPAPEGATPAVPMQAPAATPADVAPAPAPAAATPAATATPVAAEPAATAPTDPNAMQPPPATAKPAVSMLAPAAP